MYVRKEKAKIKGKGIGKKKVRHVRRCLKKRKRKKKNE